MTKRLEITPKIAAAIAKSTDGGVDPNLVAVYEWIALTTLPIQQPGTLFENGRITETTLQQMAAYLSEGKYVPLHTLHQQGYELPVGRVFDGQFETADNGAGQLRVLFYVPLTETELVGKLDTGTINEVSVGIKTQHLTCSECGFDYLSDEATLDNIWDRTCANNHVVGTNGVHTVGAGLASFKELSLVSRGASQGTRGVSPAKSLMAKANFKQYLEASQGTNPLTSLFASPTHPSKKEPAMDTNALVAEMTKAKADLAVSEHKLQTSEGSAAKLKTDLEAAQARVSELTTELAAAKSADTEKLKTDLAAAKEKADKALGFVRAEADRLAVAAGLEKPAAEADLAALTASIEASRTKLAENLPVGGASNSAVQAAQAAAPAAASFKTR